MKHGAMQRIVGPELDEEAHAGTHPKESNLKIMADQVEKSKKRNDEKVRKYCINLTNHPLQHPFLAIA